MAGEFPKAEISPLSQEFTDGNITVDVMIYQIEGNAGWTLEIALDDDASVTWAELFTTDQAAWDEFASTVEEIGLAELINGDDTISATVH